MNAPTHKNIEETIADYAIRSMTIDEQYAAQREILEHIAGCGGCRALYHDLRDVSGDLALMAAPRRAPAGLEGRILAGIRGQAPVARSTSRGIPMRMGLVAAAVMLVLVGSLATFAASIAGRLDRQEQSALGTARALSIVGRADTKTATLAGKKGSMVLAYAPDGEAVLVGSGISSPGEGRIFELWLIRGGKPLPVQVFRPVSGVIVVPVRIDPQQNDTIAITVEKSRVTTPTTDPIYSTIVSA